MRTTSGLPVEQATTLVSGKTSLSYDLGTGHGNQIEFNSTDGECYLWYPGNKTILKGKWQIRRDKDVTSICYSYAKNTYNPVTKSKGGDWECEALGVFAHYQVDRKNGDVFGISKQANAPHILARDAVAAYVPSRLPIDIPYLTNGKSPIDHLLEDFAMRSTR